MDIIKLLDVSSPKTIKDTLNSLIEHYTELEADINATADSALAKSEEAVSISNAATTSAANAVQTSNTAQQTSNEAKQIAEESLAISSQAEATADDAKTLAEGAYTESDEANLTAESALNIATEAKDLVRHALETGATGTLIHNTDGNFLVNMYRSDDVNVEDTDLTKYILTPAAVRTALSTKIGPTDYSTASKAGVASFPSWSGLMVSNGQVWIKGATDAQIKGKTEPYIPVTTTKIDLAVKEGLINNALTWTSEEKESARNLLGVGEVSGVTIRRWE